MKNKFFLPCPIPGSIHTRLVCLISVTLQGESEINLSVQVVSNINLFTIVFALCPCKVYARLTYPPISYSSVPANVSIIIIVLLMYQYLKLNILSINT